MCFGPLNLVYAKNSVEPPEVLKSGGGGLSITTTLYHCGLYANFVKLEGLYESLQPCTTVDCAHLFDDAIQENQQFH